MLDAQKYKDFYKIICQILNGIFGGNILPFKGKEGALGSF